MFFDTPPLGFFFLTVTSLGINPLLLRRGEVLTRSPFYYGETELAQAFSVKPMGPSQSIKEALQKIFHIGSNVMVLKRTKNFVPCWRTYGAPCLEVVGWSSDPGHCLSTTTLSSCLALCFLDFCHSFPITDIS